MALEMDEETERFRVSEMENREMETQSNAKTVK